MPRRRPAPPDPSRRAAPAELTGSPYTPEQVARWVGEDERPPADFFLFGVVDRPDAASILRWWRLLEAAHRQHDAREDWCRDTGRCARPGKPCAEVYGSGLPCYGAAD